MKSEKFPRMPHLPWSEGCTRDDRKLSKQEFEENFIDRYLIITEKLDGSNIAMTKDELFARSHSGSPSHPSFSYAKRIHAAIGTLIPKGLTAFFEYCYAIHSIEYQKLPSFLFLIAVRNDETGRWSSWEETESFSITIGIPTVPVLFDYDLNKENNHDLITILNKASADKSFFGPVREGLVVRKDDSFVDLSCSMAKMVRKDHVQTDDHWLNKEIRRQKKIGEKK